MQNDKLTQQKYSSIDIELEEEKQNTRNTFQSVNLSKQLTQKMPQVISGILDGFDILRLVEPSFDEFNVDFYCGICQKIVNQPMECADSTCGVLYCTFCIQNCEMCKQCCSLSSSEKFKRPSMIVQKMLNEYKIKCEMCNQAYYYQEINQHELVCQQAFCSNELCMVKFKKNGEQVVKFVVNDQSFVACSQKCKKVAKFAQVLRSNDEQKILQTYLKMLNKRKKYSAVTNIATVNKTHSPINFSIESEYRRFQTMAQNFQKSSQGTPQGTIVKTIGAKPREKSQGREKSNSREQAQMQAINNKSSHQQLIDKDEMHYQDSENVKKIQKMLAQMILTGIQQDEFCWDPLNSSKQVRFSPDFKFAFVLESNYLFRSIIGNRPFMDGVHYWEIVADARTEHELKIGVTLQQKFSVSTSFCDYDFGFGFYGTGQLRHGSNAEGKKYGIPFKKKGILGILLDMDKGALAFSIDGKSYGIAFEHQSLRRGPIWPAVSLLHYAGITLVSGLTKPANFTY